MTNINLINTSVLETVEAEEKRTVGVNNSNMLCFCKYSVHIKREIMNSRFLRSKFFPFYVKGKILAVPPFPEMGISPLVFSGWCPEIFLKPT